jgi:hypothetical protein
MAPGAPAFWVMELLRTVGTSAGADGVRLKALAWAERDDQRWELPLPVSMSDNALSDQRRSGPVPAASGYRRCRSLNPLRHSLLLSVAARTLMGTPPATTARRVLRQQAARHHDVLDLVGALVDLGDLGVWGSSYSSAA